MRSTQRAHRMKKSSLTTYKLISILSLLILSSVQFFLVYNTYELKNQQYYLSEKTIISDEYAQSIRNDKAFPGGAAIIDKYIQGSMHEIESLHNRKAPNFNQFKEQLLNNMFAELRQKNNMDSLLQAIQKKQHLNPYLKYLLTISKLDVAFQGNSYVPLYTSQQYYHGIDSAIQTVNGIVIGGTLEHGNDHNRVIALTVSSASNYSYRITFNLYVDSYNRRLAILNQMMPTFGLSLFAILSVVLLFFITFRNWIKQKKIAEMKSDFVNSITHEFHTPLAAIIVANKNLQNDKVIENRGNIKPLTDIIQRQSDRLKTLFEQVLDITSRQNLQLQKKEHALHVLLEDILLDYRLKITDETILLTFNKNAADDTIKADAFWLTTMLDNIFDNAIKYNASSSKKIDVSTYNEGNRLLLVIEDNGIGMSPEIKKHIFEKFYRHPGVLKHTTGLGLGLFYVKLCIDAHEWHIEIESTPEQGSRFIIIIPQ
ncbi:two-component system, OmpR family, phosphate regulon sensor histidine kinase PhoR [Filimonas lacunae]|uniref:histidine kinase n=1 Tax=Filimonas lacunae TaxID=477680 RepID=A0A173MQQ9_9BACT|nr:HAMP domain-containing sensor histidine kinase [Filimonas lacunae]BAV09992.1 two-component sensor histidine kinase [Filimonas lacunae]SIS82229.1 two-component system, OmpR family, phosphate regulon sensor histidine kinase PhoR [Filimonas lacunae]